MPSFVKPSVSKTQAFLDCESSLTFSYFEVGGTQKDTPVPGFDNDLNFIELGQGDAVWDVAKEAIRQWQMFPGGWACIWPENTSIQEGEVLAMQAKVMGLWWLNSCRIVYTLDNQYKYGFAYGTLPGHAECGEELFMVEKMPDGMVRYVLKAFSRPRLWIARLGYPITRFYQRKFVHASKSSMARFVAENLI